MQLLVVSHQIIAELNISSKEGAVASIQLNHPYVLDALLDICEAPSEPTSRTSLISTLAKAASKRVDDWELRRSQLSRTVFLWRKPWQCRSTLSFSWTQGFGDEYNSGLVLQLSLPGHGVLLRGGRYDKLCINSGAGERVAAGMTIYIAKLLSCLEHQRPQKHAEWRTASNGMEVDVLVCSLGASVSDQRFEIVSQLWQAGIRADLSLLESSNLREHVELAQSVGAQHVVLIRPGKLTIKQLHVGRGRGNRKAQADDETFKTCADVAKYFISRRGTRARLENNDSWRA
ncbi:MAG: hypothetical protein SGPRY_004893 [Prymnesium sp.]